MKAIKVLTLLVILLTVCSAALGLLYTSGGAQRSVTNLYGQEIVLYGDGFYANNSLLKTGATQGTDAVAIIVSILLLVTLFTSPTKKAYALLRTGLLGFLLYAATCLVMGVSFNALFLLYVAQFSCTLFAFILSMLQITKTQIYQSTFDQSHLRGTAVFMFISGCSVMVWLSMILPAVITGEPMEIIEIYTTEPTFVIDLGIILPTAVLSGIMLLRRNPIGTRLAPVLMIILICIGLCVVFQTIFQTSLGIQLPTEQIIGLVGSFVCLGIVSAVLTIRLLRHTLTA